MDEWNRALGQNPQDWKCGEARLGMSTLHLETRKSDDPLGKYRQECHQGSWLGVRTDSKVSRKPQREQEESWELSMGGG